MSEANEELGGRFKKIIERLDIRRLSVEFEREVRDAAQDADDALGAYYFLEGVPPETVEILRGREFVRALKEVFEEEVADPRHQERPELERQVVQSAAPESSGRGSNAFMDPAEWRVQGTASLLDEWYVIGCAAECVDLQDKTLKNQNLALKRSDASSGKPDGTPPPSPEGHD